MGEETHTARSALSLVEGNEGGSGVVACVCLALSFEAHELCAHLRGFWALHPGSAEVDGIESGSV